MSATASAAPAAEDLRVGPRVRALREGMGLSLRDLAERSGVSAPMLSQVERGETSPTLAVAARIAGGLELSLSQLLRLDESDGVTIVRAGERLRGGNPRRGHRYEVMTPAMPGQRAEVSLHTLAPGAATAGPGDPPMHEPGSRETAVVTAGSLLLVIARGGAEGGHHASNGESHELGEGDAVTFDADLPHHFENPGTGEARFLSVVAAGLRRS